MLMNLIHKKNFLTSFKVTSLSLLLVSCNPMKALYKEIRSYGYIVYKTPLEYSGPGTIIGGSPEHMQVMAPPQECFPDKVGGQDTGLRFFDNSTLPSSKRTVSASADASVDLLEMASAEGATVSAGAKYEIVNTLELKMEGVHIEYFNGPNLTRFYRQHMDGICKDYLDIGGFVIQAIRVEKMNYTFYNEQGLEIDLDMDNVEEILNIDVGLKYSVENNTSLVFESPRYIGYQLGRLRIRDQGLSLFRSTEIKRGKWVWKSQNVFDEGNSTQTKKNHYVQDFRSENFDRSLQIDDQSVFENGK